MFQCPEAYAHCGGFVRRVTYQYRVRPYLVNSLSALLSVNLMSVSPRFAQEDNADDVVGEEGAAVVAEAIVLKWFPILAGRPNF